MYIPEITENSLKSQLEELVYIAKKLHDELEQEDWFSMKFTFHPPATEAEIREFEEAFKLTLPVGYREFLQFSNGARLCGYIADFDDISHVMQSNSLETSPDFPKDYIVIADLIGDGEILCFSKDTGKFIRYFDGDETVYDDFYAVFQWITAFIRESAEEYVEL